MVGQHSTDMPYVSFAPMCAVFVYLFFRVRSEKILSDLFPEELLGLAAIVGAGVDLRVV